MREMLESVAQCPLVSVKAGTVLIEQGRATGRMYVLVRGQIEIVRGETLVTVLDDPGAIVGDMSILLQAPHTATARARSDVEAHFIEDGAAFFRDHPQASYCVAQMLARRLNAATTYLVDLKRQFSDQANHLEMVGEVLETLIFEQGEPVTPGSDREPGLP